MTTEIRDFRDQGGFSGPARRLFAITPNDSTSFDFATRGIYVGTAGDLAVLGIGDTVPVTLVGVPAGSLVPVAAQKVMATGTTAGSLVGMY